MNKRTVRTILLSCLISTMVTPKVWAEKFLDIYGGSNSTNDSTVEVSDQYFLSARHNANKDLEFDDGFTIGGRYGMWLEDYPKVGFAVDLSYVEVDAENADFSVVPLSALVMFRLPLLVDEEFTYGRLQPYIGGGPSLMAYDFEIDLRPERDSKIDDGSSELGLDLRAGVSWMINKSFAVFGEYRYTYVDIDYDEDDRTIFSPIFYTYEVDTDLKTHHLLFGLSYCF